MLRLLERVTRLLAARGVEHALVGAGALAAHGVSRSTFDVDLLVTDRRVLDAQAWAELSAAGVQVDVRAGDDEDPLAGVVRLSEPGERSVDVVVGRHRWETEILHRARAASAPGQVPVAAAADLVLLKLYAGGPQDAWDVEQLLAASDREAIGAAVLRVLPRLPPHAAALWRRVTGGER